MDQESVGENIITVSFAQTGLKHALLKRLEDYRAKVENDELEGLILIGLIKDMSGHESRIITRHGLSKNYVLGVITRFQYYAIRDLL